MIEILNWKLLVDVFLLVKNLIFLFLLYENFG